MKLITILTVGVAAVGMTCLVGYASAANSAPGDLISDSMLVAQGTPAPGGKSGGAPGEMGRADKGTPSGSMKQKKLGGTGADNTKPEKARPGTEKNTGTGGTTGSNSERTGKSSGSPGPSSGAGSGAK